MQCPLHEVRKSVIPLAEQPLSERCRIIAFLLYPTGNGAPTWWSANITHERTQARPEGLKQRKCLRLQAV